MRGRARHSPHRMYVTPFPLPLLGSRSGECNAAAQTVRRIGRLENQAVQGGTKPRSAYDRRPMRVMVTGGAGFIGSHLVDALLARGDEVHVVDSLATGSRDNLASAATLHELDIRDESVGELATRLRPELVFHLAAQAD